MSRWDPDSYLKFEHERTIPSHDLVARIDLSHPRAIVDIGCGPGNSTSVLRKAWPEADVTGLDNSKEMINKAQATFPGYKWILADVAEWQPDEKYDLVFSNATLHWIPNHERLLKHLFEAIEDGGAFAAQVPFNIESPLFRAIAAVSESPKWRNLMNGCSAQIFYRDEVYYYKMLSRLSSRVDMWTTTYIHIMESHQSLLEWYSSTGLKIYLERIEDDRGRRQFKTEILEACKAQYPVQSNGKILFPFKRIFFVAYKGESET
jgi:trans-aconitate 2-methyltransferase